MFPRTLIVAVHFLVNNHSVSVCPVVEESVDAAFTPPAGFAERERRAHDDAELIFVRRRAA